MPKYKRIDNKQRILEVNVRQMIFKGHEQEYAKVIKILPHHQLEAMCFDGVNRVCHIMGRLKHKVWINNGDIILVRLRYFEDSVADVIFRYRPDELKILMEKEPQLFP